MKIMRIIVLSVPVLAFFASCTDSSTKPSGHAQSIQDVEIPAGFDWDFTSETEVTITTVDAAGIPVQGKEISLYKTENNLAFTAVTNEIGKVNIKITLPESSSSVFVECDGERISVPVTGNEVNKTLVVNGGSRDTRANGTLYVPGTNSVITLMYEDNWPNKGDYDFNDMVVETWGKLRYESNYLRYVELQATVIASGATYNNGFRVMFESDAAPNTSLGDVITFSAYDADGNQLPMTSEEVHAAYGTDVIWDTFNHQLFFKYFDHVYDVMPLPFTFLALNTFNEAPWTDPVSIKIRIDYQQLISFNPVSPSLNLNSFNPYVTLDGIPGYEIHLPGDIYTSNFDQFGLFGTGDDNTPLSGLSDPLYIDTAFKTVDGLSWGLKLEGTLEYPREKADVILAYPELESYFAGTQGIFDNWWQPHPDDDYSEGYILDRGDMTVADQNAPVGE
ncbi:MAG: LruC domain-containing protein [Candidatus Cloacimonetes bacterium]|nr:LruC domain-containing protein [Candidatus Cloacimonadota bacterium]